MDALRTWLSHFVHSTTHVVSARGIPSWLTLPTDPFEPLSEVKFQARGSNSISLMCDVLCLLCHEESAESGNRQRTRKIEATVQVTRGKPIEVLPVGVAVSVCSKHKVLIGFLAACHEPQAVGRTTEEEKKRKTKAAETKKAEAKAKAKVARWPSEPELLSTVTTSDELNRLLARDPLPRKKARAILEHAQLDGRILNQAFVHAAKAGDRVAQAWCLFRGIGLHERDEKRGFAILKQLHEAGDPAATFFYGVALSPNFDVETDAAASVAHMWQGVDNGFEAGRGRLASTMSRSRGNDKSLSIAFTERAAENGCGLSQFRLGRELLKGNDKDVERGGALLAKSTHPHASSLLTSYGLALSQPSPKRGRVQGLPVDETPAVKRRPEQWSEASDAPSPPLVWTEEAVAALRDEHSREVSLLHDELRKGAAEVHRFAQEWSAEKRALEEKSRTLESKLAVSQSEIGLLRDQLSMLNKVVDEWKNS